MPLQVALQSSQLLRVRAAEFYRANKLAEQQAQQQAQQQVPPSSRQNQQQAGFNRLFKSGSMSHLNNNGSNITNNNSAKLPNANCAMSGNPSGSFGPPDFRASYGEDLVIRLLVSVRGKSKIDVPQINLITDESSSLRI